MLVYSTGYNNLENLLVSGHVSGGLFHGAVYTDFFVPPIRDLGSRHTLKRRISLFYVYRHYRRWLYICACRHVAFQS